VCHSLAQRARVDDQIMTACAESSDIKRLCELRPAGFRIPCGLLRTPLRTRCQPIGNNFRQPKHILAWSAAHWQSAPPMRSARCKRWRWAFVGTGRPPIIGCAVERARVLATAFACIRKREPGLAPSSQVHFLQSCVARYERWQTKALAHDCPHHHSVRLQRSAGDV